MINRLAIPDIVANIEKNNSPVLFLDTCAILDIVRAINRKSSGELCSAKVFFDRKNSGSIDCKIILPSVIQQEYNQNLNGTSEQLDSFFKRLSDLQNEEGENEAIELLEKTYEAKNDFSFRQRAGQVKIKQLKRKERKAKTALESSPDDEQAKAKLAELAEQLNSIELEHYRLCVENYPTDLQAKYEYGICLTRNEQYDEAIPLFQEAQRDPRHKISAMNKIGLCFFLKGWFADAIDVFNRTIESYEIKDDSTAKELRYNLARSYQEQGDAEKALEIYRKIAQLDFGYKDVRKRVDELRNIDN